MTGDIYISKMVNPQYLKISFMYKYLKNDSLYKRACDICIPVVSCRVFLMESCHNNNAYIMEWIIVPFIRITFEISLVI